MTPASPASLPPDRPRRVVVVDDSQDLRDFCALVLQQHGYQTAIFGEPMEAIDFLTQTPLVDAVVTDLAYRKCRA